MAELLLDQLADSLAARHRTLSAWKGTGSDWDPRSWNRSAIEPHEQDAHPESIDVLIDAARDSLEYLATTQSEIAGNWCDRYISPTVPFPPVGSPNYRLLTGSDSPQPHHRRSDHQFPGQAQCQPCCGGAAVGGQRTAPLQQRPGEPSCAGRRPIWDPPRPSRPRPTSWPGSSIPCCATVSQYVDAGALYYESQYRERVLRSVKQRAAQLGYRLAPIENTQDPEPELPPATATAGA